MTGFIREIIFIVAIFDAGLWGLYFLQGAAYRAATPQAQYANVAVERINEPTYQRQIPDRPTDPDLVKSAEIAADNIELIQESGVRSMQPAAKPAPAAVTLDQDAAALKRQLGEVSARGSVAEARINAKSAIETFYAERNYRPVWTGSAVPVQALVDLIDAVAYSTADGLRPADYHLSSLRQFFDIFVAADRRNLADAAKLDIVATDAYLLLAAHNYSGRFNPNSLAPNRSVDRGINLVRRMTDAIGDNHVRTSLTSLLPAEPEYQFLKDQLAVMEAVEVGAEGPTIGYGPLLQKGMTDPRVGQAKQRLAALGYYQIPAGATDADVYLFDPDFREAVVQFQKDVNLQEDGFIGEPDVSALNKFHDYRIDQIKANLERWRWLPNQLGARHVRVNVPNYIMTLWQDGRQIFESDAVVGTKATKTPIFSDQIEYLMFNPSWSVPPSIAKRQTVPSFKKDPGMIERNGYVLSQNDRVVDPNTIDWANVNPNNFPYSIRQNPGPTNAMGNVKFMFPNQHAVYLHDSSVRAFFSVSKRSHSSGCVRLRRPMELAYELVFADSGMTKQEVDDIVVPGGKETRVNLNNPVPIHIIYQSVIPGDNGQTRFLFDIYDLDERMIRAARDSVS